MTAIGLSLIYGTTQFTNFAHGEMVTFGAIITWYLNQEAGLPVLWSALITFISRGRRRCTRSTPACGVRCATSEPAPSP